VTVYDLQRFIWHGQNGSIATELGTGDVLTERTLDTLASGDRGRGRVLLDEILSL
jgi:hypothetical protein